MSAGKAAGTLYSLAVTVLRVLQAESPAFFGDVEIYVAADRREAARFVHSKV